MSEGQWGAVAYAGEAVRRGERGGWWGWGDDRDGAGASVSEGNGAQRRMRGEPCVEVSVVDGGVGQ